MKFHITLTAIILLASLTLTAQRKYTVVKFNGDTLYFDNVSAGGKTIVCKTKGQDKVKLNAADVKYYLRPIKVTVVRKGKPTVQRDTVTKIFVPEDGEIHTVLMENDSVYLSEITKTINEQEFQDYYIHYKKDNKEIMEIKEDKTAIDVLVKYFGGHCAKFDKEVEAARPKFQKMIFPLAEWIMLVQNYYQWCP
jgi:hypothetical protein